MLDRPDAPRYLPAMLIFTEAQRQLILWLYRRRNPARFKDMVTGLLGDKPKRTDQLAKTLDSLRPDFITNADIAASDGAASDTPATASILWGLTERGREIAGNVKSALQDAEAETVQMRRR